MATLSLAAQNAALQAIVDLANTGTQFPGPLFQLISDAPAAMFLGPIDASPAWSVSGGVASLINAPIDLVVTTGGTVRSSVGAGLFNRNSTGSTLIAILDFGTVGSGEDVEMITLSALAGQKFRISAFDITIG